MLNNAVPAHFIDVPSATYHTPGRSRFSSCTSKLILTLNILYHKHCCLCAACLHLLIRACTLLYVKATVMASLSGFHQTGTGFYLPFTLLQPLKASLIFWVFFLLVGGLHFSHRPCWRHQGDLDLSMRGAEIFLMHF